MISEAERVQIRKWLGYSALGLSLDSRLESAIITVQSTADGGNRPDNTTELAIRGWLANLATAETKWLDLLGFIEAYKADDAGTVDPVRGLAGLKQIGRMYVGFISDALSTPPQRDVFSGPPPGR